MKQDGQYQIQLYRQIELILLIRPGRIAVSERTRDVQENISLSFVVYLVKLNDALNESKIIPLQLRPHAHSFTIFSLQYSSDGSEIIGGSNDTYVYIYDLEKQKRTLRVKTSTISSRISKFIFRIHQVQAHNDDINAVRFVDSSNSLVASGSDDNFVYIWDRRALKESHPKPVGVFAGHTKGVTFIHSRVSF